MNDQRRNHNHRGTPLIFARGIIVCGSCGDRTTATESKLSVRTVNIGASVCIQYGHNTPCLPIINSMNNRWNNHTHCVALLFVVSLSVVRAEIEQPQRRASWVSVLKILAPVYMYSHTQCPPIVNSRQETFLGGNFKTWKVGVLVQALYRRRRHHGSVWVCKKSISLCLYFGRSPTRLTHSRGAPDKKIWF